jgi:uridine phosphorylase
MRHKQTCIDNFYDGCTGVAMTEFTGVDDRVGKYVFIPGSVERAGVIASHLEDAVHQSSKRDFAWYTATLAGEPVSVVSTGIGECSATMAVEELITHGARVFLRIGSCASASPSCGKGDVIVASGAARMEGASFAYLPASCPCIPDARFLRLLCQETEKRGYPLRCGVTITKDSFFTEVNPQDKPVGQDLVKEWDAFVRAGATTSSMEEATLFALGRKKGVRVASIAICATNFQKVSNDYPGDWENRAILAGIDAMRVMIGEECHG